MKVADFDVKLMKKYGGRVNKIEKTKQGYYVVVLNGGSTNMDVKNGRLIFYKSVSSLMRNSKSFVKSYKTVLIQMRGTDYAKAKVIEL